MERWLCAPAMAAATKKCCSESGAVRKVRVCVWIIAGDRACSPSFTTTATGLTMERAGALLLLLAALCACVNAATITVDSNGDTLAVDGGCTLREAIRSANGISEADCEAGDPTGEDIIEITVTGTITLMATNTEEDAAADGDLDVLADVTIRTGSVKRGAPSPTVTIVAGGLYNVFHMPNANTFIRLEGIEISSGHNNGQGNWAGGIVNAAVLTLDNVVVSNNAATYASMVSAAIAGGMYNTGTVIANNVRFVGNTADVMVIYDPMTMGLFTAECSGGIYTFGGLEFTDFSFDSNVGMSNRTADGSIRCSGAVTSDAIVQNAVIFNDGDFTSNSGMSGGAMALHGTVLRMNDVEFDANNAVGDGGAIHTNSHIDWRGTGTRNAINNAAGEAGGVIYSTSGHVVIDGLNSISYNGGFGGNGGAIRAQDHVYVSNVGSAVQNSATAFGGFIHTARGATLDGVSVLSDNVGTFGGVVYAFNDDVVIKNGATISSNIATTGGGGVAYARNGAAHITSVSVVESNTANTSGGVLFATRDATMSNVGGVALNAATTGGGAVLYAGETAAISYATGIATNVATGATLGGGVLLCKRGIIEDVGYIFNNAALAGGVIYAESEARIERVFGGIYDNTATNSGGVIETYSSTERQRALIAATGRISNNVASAGSGGVIYMRRTAEALAEIHSVTGGIYENSCGDGGGVVRAAAVFVADVSGDIVDNIAAFGGVIYAVDTAQILRVDGEISRNAADHGGVIYGESVIGNMIIDGVVQVTYNTASLDGGVFYTPSAFTDALLTNVALDVVGNSARDGGVMFAAVGTMSNIGGVVDNNSASSDGGVMYVGSAVVENVLGISFNSASVYGGALYAYSGVTTVHDIGSTGIRTNTADYGGFAFAQGSTSIVDVAGPISSNSVLQSGGVVYITSGKLLLRNTGALDYNVASDSGAVIYSSSSEEIRLEDVTSMAFNGNANLSIITALTSSAVTIDGVYYGIHNNSGVVYTDNANVWIGNVGGISYNTDASPGTSVVYAQLGDTLLYNVGDIAFNSCTSDDEICATAVFTASGSIRASYVGDIAYNTSSNVYGGVFRANSGSSVIRLNYVGDIFRNSIVTSIAPCTGGTVVGSYGDVYITNTGDISYNVAQCTHDFSDPATLGDYGGGEYAGGVALAGPRLTVRSVGSVFENSALEGGAFSAGTVIIDDVSGDVFSNTAVAGGFAYGSSVSITQVDGTINGNVAYQYGGVAAATRVYTYDTGAIFNNTAYYGGAFYSNAEINISDVYSLEGNTAVVGGVVYARGVSNGEVSIANVTADIAYNVSSVYGGVVAAAEVCFVTDVGGRIAYNETGPYNIDSTSYGGGVLHCTSAHIRGVGQDISYNVTHGGIGGVAHASSASGIASISNVAGDICYNIATSAGGVVGGYSVFVYDIGGDLCSNHQTAPPFGMYYAYSGGGVAFGFGTATIHGIAGSVSNNSSYYGYGGVLAAGLDTSLHDVGGSISGNVALVGGVAAIGKSFPLTRGISLPVLPSSVRISDVGGDIDNNSASDGGVVYIVGGTFSSITIDNVRGNISYNNATGSALLPFNQSGLGGVVYVEIGAVEVNDIGGEVAYNSSRYGGGVIYVDDGTVLITGVYGALRGNSVAASCGPSCGNGGVATATGNIVVHDIGGLISNTAPEQGGCFNAIGLSAVKITHVNGPIADNSGYSGGVAVGFDVAIRDVQEIYANVAYRGGVALGLSSCTIENTGDISYNVATGDGGVASGTSVSIRHTDSVVYNTAGGSGGVIYAQFAGSLEHVSGDVSGNNAGLYGGVLESRDTGRLAHVSGDVDGNFAAYGGVIDAETDGVVEHIGGNVSNNYGELGGAIRAFFAELTFVTGSVTNQTATHGGVIYCSYGSIQQLGGSLSNNGASFFGGVAHGITLSLTDIAGDVALNTAAYGGVLSGDLSADVQRTGNVIYNSAARGGVLYLERGPGTITDVLAIEGNEASDYGGVVYAAEHVVIARATSIANNSAGHGGVIANYGYDASILDVPYVVDNSASNEGGVIWNSDGSDLATCSISNVQVLGGNSAGSDGGVIFCDGFSDIVNVHSITDNSSGGNGGVIAATAGASISDVVDVSENSSSDDGGVVFTSFGNVALSNIEERVCSNHANGDGGVVHSGADAVWNNVEGQFTAIVNNTASGSGDVMSGANVVLNVPSGFLSGNGADVLSSSISEKLIVGVNAQNGAVLGIQQQPSDGTERVPLPVQPHLNVTGALSGVDLPITVVVLDGGVVVEERPISDFEVEFGDSIRFIDFHVTEPGTFTVEFRLQYAQCETNSTAVVVVASVESDPFTVGECFSPSPAICPEAAVSLVNEPGLCSAQFNLTAPTTDQCAFPTITSSADPQGPFSVGTTLFEWVLSSANGEDFCIVDISVTDVERPVLNCTDVNVVADAGQCTSIVDVPLPTVTDNCLPADVHVVSSHPSPVYPVGTTVVTFTGTDVSGNVGTCNALVTVQDTEVPFIHCVAPPAERKCDAVASFHYPEAHDNCGVVTVEQISGVAAGEVLLPGVNSFEFTATDASGLTSSCSFTVTTNSTWYFDNDSDGVGAGAPVFGCPSPGVGWVEDKGSDCDDTRADLGLTVFIDLDQDTWGSLVNTECVEYDFFDTIARRDVDGLERGREVQKRDVNGILFVARTGDCDDGNPLINPEAREVCNDVDDNCNGLIDEGIVCTGIQIIVSDSTTTYPMPSIPFAPLAPPAPIIVLPTPRPSAPTGSTVGTDKRFTGLIAFRSTSGAAEVVVALVFTVLCIGLAMVL